MPPNLQFMGTIVAPAKLICAAVAIKVIHAIARIIVIQDRKKRRTDSEQVEGGGVGV